MEVNTKVNILEYNEKNNGGFNRVNNVEVKYAAVSQDDQKTDDWIKPKKVFMPRHLKGN